MLVASSKGWWEKPVGIIALGVLVTVIGTLIAWFITRHYDAATKSTLDTQSQTQPQPAQPAQNHFHRLL